MKKTVISLAAAFLACLAVVGILFAVRGHLCEDIYDQTAAERWGVDGKGFVQMSAFISENAGMNAYGINEMRLSISNRLSEQSAGDGDGEPFFDAYSAKSSVGISRDTKKAQATAYFTGGDFFRFHSLDIISGWYYNEYDLMDDCVLINTYAAWQLFGGFDLTGESLEVDGYPCIVYGVFDDSDENTEAVPVIYANYSLLYKMGRENSPITCYEAVIPEPVKNFAETLFTDSVTVSKNQCEIVRNTGRYSFKRAVSGIKGFLSRTDKNSTVIYPAWENSARRTETVSIILAFLILVFAVFPTGLIAFAVILLYIKKRAIFTFVREKLRRR